MPDAAYLQAAIPEPFTILGRKLKPYSVGHELILQRFKNGFAIDSEMPPDLDDLAFAIWICSQSHAEALASLHSRWTPFRFRMWGWSKKGKRLDDKFHLMLEYMTQAMQRPEAWSKGDVSSKEPGTPWIQILIACLMRQGMSYKEALEAPYALALWFFYSEAERESRVELVTQHQRELWRAANGT